MSDIIYLTGSSGFIGNVIIEQCDSDESISKVYCPIRNKKDKTGHERFKEYFGNSRKAVHIDPDDKIPEDVTIVILNAYAVKFFNEVETILSENVTPMLKLLDECRVAGSRIRGISVVSTAYVQEPKPYLRDKYNRMEFVLKDYFKSAFDLYSDLVGGRTTWKEVEEKYGHAISSYHKYNNYAFSKHIMEHVIHEQYPDLSLCVVRPSIVAHSRDGRHGHGRKTGFPLFVDIAKKPIVRFPRNEGTLDLVFVDDVAKDILLSAMEFSEPAKLSEKFGTMFHPIMTSTTNCGMTSIEMLKIGAPEIKRFDIRNNAIRSVLRNIELISIGVLAGKKKAKLVKLVYENFDPIMCKQWDYPQMHTMTKADLDESVQRFFSLAPKTLIGEKKESKNGNKNLNFQMAMVVLFCLFCAFQYESPNLQVVCAFILLRLLVLSAMQNIFYGDTSVRQNVMSTINKKGYDQGQHKREEVIWPSVLVSGLELFLVFEIGLLPSPSTMPLISWKCLYLSILTHALPVEFVYYWAHRVMHEFPSLYKIHKHHHLSIVPSPKTSVTFLWSEHFFYDIIFSLPVILPYLYAGESSLLTTLFYIPVFDLVNTLGHTNLELFPRWYLDCPIYPFFYCSTYHHVHHRYFKYNYALFMPIYDMVFGTYSEYYTKRDFDFAKKHVS